VAVMQNMNTYQMALFFTFIQHGLVDGGHARRGIQEGTCHLPLFERHIPYFQRKVRCHHCLCLQVLPFMESDLEAVIRDRAIILSPGHIKSYMKMLLSGLEACHSHWIVHRCLHVWIVVRVCVCMFVRVLEIWAGGLSLPLDCAQVHVLENSSVVHPLLL